MGTLGEPAAPHRHPQPLTPGRALAPHLAAAAPCAQQQPPGRPRHRAPLIGRRRGPAPRYPIGRRGAEAQGQAGGGRGSGGSSRAAIGWRGGVRIVRPRRLANGEGGQQVTRTTPWGGARPGAAAAPAADPCSGRGRTGIGARRLPPRSPAGAPRLRTDAVSPLRPLTAPALMKRWKCTGGGVVVMAAAAPAAFAGWCQAGESVQFRYTVPVRSRRLAPPCVTPHMEFGHLRDSQPCHSCSVTDRTLSREANGGHSCTRGQPQLSET